MNNTSVTSICKLKRLLFLIFYYAFAQHLPNSFFYGGKLSNGIRKFACKRIFKKFDNVRTIQRHVYFGNGNNLQLGNNSGLGENFSVHDCDLIIKQNVMIAKDVSIIGGGHNFIRTDIPMCEQGKLPRSNIVIENDVWIGERAVILGNVKKIGTGAIIGACCVVTKDVPDFAIIVGNPAIIKRYRK